MLLRGLLSNPPKTLKRVVYALERPPVAEVAIRVRVPQHQLKQPNHRLTPTEIEELIALYAEGASFSELGRRFGIHRVTAMRLLQRRGIPLRSQS